MAGGEPTGARRPQDPPLVPRRSLCLGQPLGRGPIGAGGDGFLPSDRPSPEGVCMCPSFACVTIFLVYVFIQYTVVCACGVFCVRVFVHMFVYVYVHSVLYTMHGVWCGCLRRRVCARVCVTVC